MANDQDTTPSAPSILLTLLGEFVLPREGEAWTGTLVTALGALGVEPKAARQALARTAADGLLTSTKHGRTVRQHLTPKGTDLLREGADRIYGFMRRPRTWDGRWLVLSVAVPETQRTLRHRLRTKLTWLGLGSPSPGLWIVPDADKEADLRSIVAELGLEDRAYAWTGTAVSLGDPVKVLKDAWNLDDVEKRYLAFVDRVDAASAKAPRDVFVHQVRLIQEWRRFPFLDPDLPAELLDHDWPGPRAAAAFHDRRNRWHRRAQEEWDRMEAEAGARS